RTCWFRTPSVPLDWAYLNRRTASPRSPTMSDPVVPPPTPETAPLRKKLAPEIHDAFVNFSKAVFRDGALDEKTKQLIAVAVAHATQCPYCIRGHTKAAERKGATPE